MHSSGLGFFSTGDLTDGTTQSCAGGDAGCNEMTLSPSAVVGIWGSPDATPSVEIVFDLGAAYLVESITVGTAHRGCCSSGVPDDVDVSFSTTGSDPGDFGSEANYSLWTSEPAGDSHHEITLDIPDDVAAYVRLSFDGGSVVTSENKYFLDEVTIMGSEPPPVPALGLPGLALLALVMLLVGRLEVRRRSMTVP